MVSGEQKDGGHGALDASAESPALADLSRRDCIPRTLELLLFIIVLVPYAFFVHPVTCANQYSRIALARAIVEEGRLSIDSYHEPTSDKILFRGHYYTDKAIGSSLLAVPAHAVLKGLFGYYSDVWTRYAIVLTALAVPSAIASVLLMRILVALRPELSVSGALVLVLLYSLGTPALPFSTLYYSHQQTAALMIASFYCLIRVQEGLRVIPLMLLAGFLASLAAITEHPAKMALVALAIYAAIAVEKKARWMWFAVGAVAPLIVEVVYNVSVLGSPFAVSYLHHVTYGQMHQHGLIGLGLPTWTAFYGITVSPYRGLFYLCPFLLFSLPGFYWMWRAAHRSEAMTCAVIFAVFFLTNVTLGAWEGVASIGPRFAVPALPFLIVPLCFAYDRFRPVIWGLGAVGILFMLIATVVDPRATPEVLNPIWNFYLPLLAKKALTRTLLWSLGLSTAWATGILAVILAAAIVAMQRALKRRFVPAPNSHMSLRPAIAAGVAFGFLAAVFAAHRFESPEASHRERGEAFYWASTSRSFNLLREAEREFLLAKSLRHPAGTETPQANDGILHLRLGEIYLRLAERTTDEKHRTLRFEYATMAVDELSVAARLFPDEPGLPRIILSQIYAYLGLAYGYRADYTNAADYLTRALRLNTENVLARRALESLRGTPSQPSEQ